MPNISLMIAVEQCFGWLIAEGNFCVSDIRSEQDTAGQYESVQLIGKNVVILLSCDIKESYYVDCWVGRVMDGSLVTDRRKGGYWQSLFGYMVEIMGKRSLLNIRQPRNANQQDIARTLGDYSEVILKYCEAIRNDDEFAFAVIG